MMASPLLHQFHVEQASIDELDAVMAVMESAFGDTYGEAWTRSQCAGILPMAGVTMTVARGPDRRIAGFALARTVIDDCELLLIAVAPQQHRQGIGQLLLDDFLGRARALGVVRVHLEVRDGNPAVAMYRRAGFAQAARRSKYYRATDGRTYDALTFVRQL